MKPIVLALCLACCPLAVLADEVDDREVLALSETQRAHVLGEMRTLLAGVQAIIAALATDDMAGVAAAARALGMDMARMSEPHLRGAVPQAFMQMGMGLHQDFDQIAADANTAADPALTLRQLSESMNKCVACHASFQIRTDHEARPTAPRGNHQH